MSKIKILIPIYNDWKSVLRLLEAIDLQIKDSEHEITILIINDASSEKRPKKTPIFKKLKFIQIINMKKNKGHAKCNATGLKYINENEVFDYVIPMDGDGEDRPEELSLLIEKLRDFPESVITANRIKRSENFIFKTCYEIHKLITFIFTGESIKFGNYCCLPKNIVNKMSNNSSTWISFSGSLAKISKDRKFIPSIRGIRYFGPSKMSFFNLIKHSLSIIAVFKSILIIRSLLFLIIYLFLIIENISTITLLPIILIILMMISVILISKKKNSSEFKDSLDNIETIEELR